MSSMDTLSGDIARERARIQDLVLEELLDKHGLKGKTEEELRLMGYELARGSSGDPYQEVVTWKLFKFVDSTSYKFKVNLDYEEAPDA